MNPRWVKRRGTGPGDRWVIVDGNYEVASVARARPGANWVCIAGCGGDIRGFPSDKLKEAKAWTMALCRFAPTP